MASIGVSETGARAEAGEAKSVRIDFGSGVVGAGRRRRGFLVLLPVRELEAAGDGFVSIVLAIPARVRRTRSNFDQASFWTQWDGKPTQRAIATGFSHGGSGIRFGHRMGHCGSSDPFSGERVGMVRVPATDCIATGSFGDYDDFDAAGDGSRRVFRGNNE